MGSKQSNFLAQFKQAFEDYIGYEPGWSGGQTLDNCAAFTSPYSCRRVVGVRASERFELGDITTFFSGWKVVIEFENKDLPLSNILKYWPYLRGELDTNPKQPIILCHFSDWWSYATRRDLWEWTLLRMQADPDKLVNVIGKQFDHGGEDQSLRASSISSAISWIVQVAEQKREAAL